MLGYLGDAVTPGPPVGDTLMPRTQLTQLTQLTQ